MMMFPLAFHLILFKPQNKYKPGFREIKEKICQSEKYDFPLMIANCSAFLALDAST
jgi:hypothetical protein